jgi:hypothetical protein
MALHRLQKWFHSRSQRPANLPRESVCMPEDLAEILDRAATEKPRLTWEALQHDARGAELPLEVLVARAWGRRFPFVELVAAGMRQGMLATYERDWARCSPGEQTRRLRKAFAYAAALQGRPQGVKEG